MEVQLAHILLMRGIEEGNFTMKDDPFIIHIYGKNCYTNESIFYLLSTP